MEFLNSRIRVRCAAAPFPVLPVRVAVATPEFDTHS